MSKIRFTTMRFALRDAAAGKLEQAWLYFQSSDKPTLETPCLVVDADAGDDPQSIAVNHGFPQEGLDTTTIEDTCETARLFQNPATDELLLESFVYYWRFDAWLPSPGAPDPPAWEEVENKSDREFFEALEGERFDVPCRSEGCQRGAILQSVFCRVHHYEMIKKKPCPFGG